MPRGHQYDLIYWHQKAHVNTEQVPPPPPGHTIILLKSNQFNMATIPVKRSIFFPKNINYCYLIRHQERLWE